MFKGSKLMFKGSKLLTLCEDRTYLHQFISIILLELVSTTIEVRTQWMWRFSTETIVSTNLSSSCFNSNSSALPVRNFYFFCFHLYNIQICIFYEFNGSNIWIHTNMNSYKMNSLILHCKKTMNSYIVRIHKFIYLNHWIHRMYKFVLYEFRREWVAWTARAKPKLRARSACKPQGQNPSTPPAPTRRRLAAPTVRVACSCPDS